MLTVERIRDADALAALATEWRALHAKTAPCLPFAGPDWSLGWWQHLRRRGFAVDDRLHAYALRDPDGTLVAVAPMMVAASPGIGPALMRELQFFGADCNVTEWRGLVAENDRVAEATRALAEAIAVDRPLFDQVQWRGLPLVPSGESWSEAIPGFVHDRSVACHLIDLPDSWATLQAGLPRNIRESLRKCRNSLVREGYHAEARVADGPAAIDAALDRLVRLHRARAVAPGMKPHADVFRDPAVLPFLRDQARRGSDDRVVRVFELEIGGTVVASRIGFVVGHQLYLYYSGFDPRWARYSVMTTLLAEAIRWAIAAGLKSVNLSMGTDVSKTRWRPREVIFEEGRQGTGSWRIELASMLRSVVRRARTARRPD